MMDNGCRYFLSSLLPRVGYCRELSSTTKFAFIGTSRRREYFKLNGHITANGLCN